MNNLVQKISIFLILLFVTINSFSQTNDFVTVKLSLPAKDISTYKDLSITLDIRSTKKILEMPKGALWGYATEGAGFFSIQLQKKENGVYQDIKGIARIDEPAEADIDTLYIGDHREFTESIDWLFHYYKGEYRIRILCYFSNLNKIENQYSNWVYFVCRKEITHN